MGKIKFDMAVMKYMALFENITQTKIKDCMATDKLLTFVVAKNEAGKAIGKNGINVKKMQDMTKKNVRIIEFNESLEHFIRNLIQPIVPKEISIEDGIATITAQDHQSRGFLIGRDANILRKNEKIIKRYFDLKELKVA